MIQCVSFYGFARFFFYFILFSISVVGCFLFDWRDIFGSANVTSKQVPTMMTECALFSFCVEIYENWRWWLCKLVFWSSAVEQFLWFVFFFLLKLWTRKNVGCGQSGSTGHFTNNGYSDVSLTGFRLFSVGVSKLFTFCQLLLFWFCCCSV